MTTKNHRDEVVTDPNRPVASERRPYLSILVILKIPFILSKTRPAGLPERGGPEIVPDAACYSGGAC